MAGERNWERICNYRRPSRHREMEWQFSFDRGWLDEASGRLRQLLLLYHRGEDGISDSVGDETHEGCLPHKIRTAKGSPTQGPGEARSERGSGSTGEDHGGGSEPGRSL